VKDIKNALSVLNLVLVDSEFFMWNTPEIVTSVKSNQCKIEKDLIKFLQLGVEKFDLCTFHRIWCPLEEHEVVDPPQVFLKDLLYSTNN
jgi:hypothetical protein